MPLIRFEIPGADSSTLTLTKAIKVTKHTSVKLLGIKILQLIKNKFNFYNIEPQAVDTFLMGRPWLSQDDFEVSIETINEVLDQNLKTEINSKYFYSSNFNLANKDKAENLKKYYYEDINFGDYGEPLLDNYKNIIGYKINSTDCAKVHKFYDKNNNNCNEISIREFNPETNTFEDETFISWIDTETENGFIREFEDIKYFYNKENQIYNVEKIFECLPFPSYHTDKIKDNKIGTIDLETFGSNSGTGSHQVYAGGWSVTNKTELFYLKPNETGEQLINRLFLSIVSQTNLNGYTFYAHNLGRFDSIFILKSLVLSNKFKVTPIWKDTGILSVTIEYGKFKIKLLDSLQLIKGDLANILISFNCGIQKGYLPYSFINKENLYYIGDKPTQTHYNNITDLDYSNIPNKDWDLKKETLIYLKSDLEGLLEALTKFSELTFDEYKLNITKFKTLPSLALGVYTSKYMSEGLQIKMIKGEIEKEIRSSYYGGNVEVYANEISEGYYYDMNSQYPRAMLEDMPVGNPKLSLETNLDKIFGFVYGEISCPDENILQVPFIQFKDPNTNLNVCPRGNFKRLIFSEEIKYALQYGYKINIEYSYIFERGKDLFKEFVNYHYEIKKLSKDSVQKNMAKFLLNSLYGRMGMKEIDSTIEIINLDEAKQLEKKSNISIFSHLGNNKVLVKYSDSIPRNIRNLYKKNNSDPNLVNKRLSKSQLKELDLFKKRGVPSAVHIASAIAAYSRILINEYKNIKDNPCIMSDTDSVVLEKPLSDELIGEELGQMKLEYKIKKAIFIRKKLYYILTTDGQEVIKASGLDSSKLNYKLFLMLLSGKSIEVERVQFKVGWKDLTLNVEKSNIIVKGLKEKIKPTKPIETLEIKSNNIENFDIKYSYFELITLFIFLSSYFIIFGYFLYKIY